MSCSAQALLALLCSPPLDGQPGQVHVFMWLWDELQHYAGTFLGMSVDWNAAMLNQLFREIRDYDPTGAPRFRFSVRTDVPAREVPQAREIVGPESGLAGEAD